MARPSKSDKAAKQSEPKTEEHVERLPEAATEANARSAENDQAGPGIEAQADQPTPAPCALDSIPLAELRKEFSDAFPYAEAKEMLEQMQVQLARLPKRIRDRPNAKVYFHVEVPIETIAFLQAWMPHIWPSRRARK